MSPQILGELDTMNKLLKAIGKPNSAHLLSEVKIQLNEHNQFEVTTFWDDGLQMTKQYFPTIPEALRNIKKMLQAMRG